MRNVVFVSLNGNVIEISKKIFHKNNFFLKYLNKFCGYFVPKDDKRISIAFNIIPKGEFGDITRKIYLS